jgi:hypothetical protein
VAIQGATAYVAANSGGLAIVDVANPSNPKEIGTYRASQALFVAVTGSTAYVGGRAGLQILDVANPTSPQVLGSLAGWAFHVAPIGSDLAILWWDVPPASLRLGVLDGRSPSNLALVGSFTLPNASVAAGQSLAAACPYLYLADFGLQGLWILRAPASVQC